MAHPRIARTLFDLLVIIDGESYRCTQVTTNFYLNKIPVASCTLAVGRHVHTLQPARSHSTLFTKDAGTSVLKEAEIRLIPKGEWEPLGEKWPAGGAVIFRGYVTGVGVRTLRGSIRATVQIIHWLADLNFSSALSNQSHPANPADLSWRAIYVGEGQGTTLGTPHFLHQMVAQNLCTTAKIKLDFWAKSLQPILWNLAKFDQIKTLPGLGVRRADDNAQAIKALERIRGGENGADKGPDYVPLTLKIGGAVEHEMAKAIEFYLKQELSESWWSTTIWSKLVGQFAPAFMFAVVPQVETALVVPYIPGTRKLWKDIRNTEYDYIDTVSVIPRPIQAVAIYTGIITETGEGGSRNPGRELGIGGHFRPENAEQGMLMVLRPSGWMQRIPGFGENVGITAGGIVPAEAAGEDDAGGLAPIPMVTCPDAKVERGNEWGHDIEQVAIESKDMFDRLARAIYVQEVLRGRFGVIHGKLRFDIAPGSTVRIEGSADPFIGTDALRPNLIGEVHRVTCSLDAEGSKAGTSFQLVSLRTELENEQDTTSVEEHPLYEQVFAGSPLSEDLAFRPETDEE